MSTYYYQYQSLHFVHIKVFAWYLQELWNLATTLNPVYVQEPNFNSHFWSSNGNHVMSIWTKRHVFRRYPEIKTFRWKVCHLTRWLEDAGWNIEHGAIVWNNNVCLVSSVKPFVSTADNYHQNMKVTGIVLNGSCLCEKIASHLGSSLVLRRIQNQMCHSLTHLVAMSHKLSVGNDE